MVKNVKRIEMCKINEKDERILKIGEIGLEGRVDMEKKVDIEGNEKRKRKRIVVKRGEESEERMMDENGMKMFEEKI